VSRVHLAAADLSIALAINNATVPNIVDGFYSAATGGTLVQEVKLKEGEKDSAKAYIGSPSAGGSYVIQATAAGIASVTSSTVNVVPPQLKFSVASITVGKGLQTHSTEVRVSRSADGTDFAAPQALDVVLTSSDATKAAVPNMVTIKANEPYANFMVRGVDLTNTDV
jgi:trimeric autotransporter adhesin